MKKGDTVKTPRFMTVTIETVISKKSAEKQGYKEPTHYEDPDYDILGKNIGDNKMKFAAVRKSENPAEKLEHVETEIVAQGNQTQFPQFLEKSPAVEIVDNAKLSNQLDKTSEFIRKEIENVAKSFCRIGFKLWEARENKFYLGKEFKNIYEYAESVLGFKKASTANYIAICERFSVHKNDKPTAQLLSDFASFSYTQLSLMLSVPNEKLTEITPDATCKQIRDMKKEASKSDSDQDGENYSLNEYLSKARPPIQLFSRVLTDQNIDLVIKLLRENIGRDIQILVEDEEPKSGGGGDAQ